MVSKSNGLEFYKQNGQRFESLQVSISQCGESDVIQSKTMFINFLKTIIQLSLKENSTDFHLCNVSSRSKAASTSTLSAFGATS